MHIEDGVPVVVGHLEQEVVADDTGVVDQHRRRAQLIGDSDHRRRHLFRVGHAGPDGQGAAARLGDLAHGVLAGGLVEIEDGDVHAVGSEPASGGGADATSGTGDDGDSSHGSSLQTTCTRSAWYG